MDLGATWVLNHPTLSVDISKEKTKINKHTGWLLASDLNWFTFSTQ